MAIAGSWGSAAWYIGTKAVDPSMISVSTAVGWVRPRLKLGIGMLTIACLPLSEICVGALV